MGKVGGYTGRILILDMTKKAWSTMELDESVLKKYVGGAALGAKLLYDLVPPTCDPLGPENKIIMTVSPVTGTTFPGTSMVNVVTKSAMMPMALSAQTNGMLGRKLKASGYDGVVIEGRADTLQYVCVTENNVTFGDADFLVGKKCTETERLLKERLGLPKGAVACVGPSGENLVKFSAIESCEGHYAASLGPGCIMGSKNLKAILFDGDKNPEIIDTETFEAMQKQSREAIPGFSMTPALKVGGTSATLDGLYKMGMVPIKNCTQSTYDKMDMFDGVKLHTQTPAEIKFKRETCYGCPIAHTRRVEVLEGKYKGMEFDEAEYEGLAVFGPNLGLENVLDTLYLNAVNDELGMDLKEAGFLMSWAIEAYEKGILSKEDTDGLELTWGNVDAIAMLLDRIAYKSGKFADILSNGLMYASKYYGEESSKLAFYAKGHGPHGHDCRSGLLNGFFQCISDTGSNQMGSPSALLPAYGIVERLPQGSPMDAMVERAGSLHPYTMWLDTFCGCHFTTKELPLDCQVSTLNAVTGWNLTAEECLHAGNRCSQLFRTFSLLAGLTPADDVGSYRMIHEAPDGGLSPGVALAPMFDWLKAAIYKGLGRDPVTSKPTVETLKRIDLEELIPVLWGSGEI